MNHRIAASLLAASLAWAEPAQRLNYGYFAQHDDPGGFGKAVTGQKKGQPVPHESLAISMAGSPLGICWGMVYGRPFSTAEVFLPQVRKLNAGFTRVILFWSQLEPAKGEYHWEVLDSYLDQLQSPDEGMLTIYSASPWATRNSTWVFPPSPARDPEDYSRFIRALVLHAKGRVRYFQNDSEPNNPMFWSGSKEEFVGQLRLFAKAVRGADANAKVVLGGSDGLFDPTGTHPLPGQQQVLDYFDYVLAEAAEDFDVFDLHLYADPYTIPARVEFMRNRMAARGYAKPIIAAEYNGPSFFEFPVNRKYFRLMAEMGVKESADVRELYAAPQALAPETQMFLQGAPAALEERLQRLQARDLVIRNILAFSAGVQKMAFWDIWHETEKRDQVKTLLYGKLKLLEHKDGELSEVLPLGRAYREMAAQLRGVESVERMATGDASIYAFQVRRRDRGPVGVVWMREEGPGREVSLPGVSGKVAVTDIPRFFEMR